jgi:hypothetical protein
MPTKIFNSVISDHERRLCLDWFATEDKLTDARPDVVTKKPLWGDTNWPKEPIKKVLDQVLDKPYRVSQLIFHELNSAFRLHVDSANGENDLYKIIIIPLKLDGPSSTVIFDNHWYGPSGRFSKKVIPQYEYTLEVNGVKEYIPDMREFKTDNIEIQTLLDDLIKKRHEVDNRYYDYSQITNINDKPFNQNTHENYMPHIPYENLHGLTVDQIVEWQEGSVFTFDRTQLHCGTNTHNKKFFCTVFTFKT